MMMLAVKNTEIFNTNKDYYDINTRQHISMHMNQVNLAKYGKGVHHMTVKIFNRLPVNLKEISNNPKKFKVSMKEFLTINAFYTLDEFFIK
jgi:maltooligosyltrehalose synthase